MILLSKSTTPTRYDVKNLVLSPIATPPAEQQEHRFWVGGEILHVHESLKVHVVHPVGL